MTAYNFLNPLYQQQVHKQQKQPNSSKRWTIITWTHETTYLTYPDSIKDTCKVNDVNDVDNYLTLAKVDD